MRDPIVFRHEDDENHVQLYRRFTMLPAATQRDILKLAVQHDVAQGIAGLLSVESSGKMGDFAKIMHLQDIISTNGLGIRVDDPESPGGLYLNACRMNYSCVHNAEHVSYDDGGHKVILANRDIDAGEEITTSYIANWLSRELRQSFLQQWGFTCQCPACDSSNPDSHSHERRLKKLHRLHQDSCMDTAGRLRAGGTWSYTTLEQAANRAQQRIELFTGHHVLRRFSRQAYMPLYPIRACCILTVYRCLGAFDIALAQYKMRRLESKLADAVKLWQLVVEADRLYFGDTHAVTREDEEVYEKLQKGDIPGVKGRA